MDRHLHKKYIPQCARHIAIVDQYMWDKKDTNSYTCINGISNPIYDCKGWINYTLPLDMYPRVNEIHPEIMESRNYHLNKRPSESIFYQDTSQSNIEHFSNSHCPGEVYISTQRRCGYLPDPYRSLSSPCYEYRM